MPTTDLGQTPTPPEEGLALASTAGALHRIAAFISGDGSSGVVELRNEAIRLAGERLSAQRLADSAGVPLDLVMAILCS